MTHIPCLVHRPLLRRQRLVVAGLWWVAGMASAATAMAAAPTAPAASVASAVSTVVVAAPAAVLAPIPVYATRLPPPAQLEYSLRSGLMRGTGLLSWTPTSEGYRMSLEGTVFGLSVMNWRSEGGIDPHGLAPLRFTDQRLNRNPRVASFERDAGRITYTGRPKVQPLPAGAQDRLSWMVQLPAVLLADPALQQAGRRIVLFVSGARADADAWTFEVMGRESLDLPVGRMRDALRLKRVTDQPGDTMAEAWLDPARGLLPVRVRFTAADGKDVTEFLLAR